MPKASLYEPLAARLAKLPQPPALGDVQRALYSTLSLTIAIPWLPHAGPNHYEAVLADIATAINRHKPSRGVRLAVSSAAVSSKILSELFTRLRASDFLANFCGGASSRTSRTSRTCASSTSLSHGPARV